MAADCERRVGWRGAQGLVGGACLALLVGSGGGGLSWLAHVRGASVALETARPGHNEPQRGAFIVCGSIVRSLQTHLFGRTSLHWDKTDKTLDTWLNM